MEEIVGELERERGALPLLAFTASRLWEHRDRENGLLSRKAYWAIGGVAGSLAQHAETTMDRIGEERQPIVREMFRALVTAQGTRVSRERDELLSVTADRRGAAETLDRLVEARLLTSFEAVDPSDPEIRRQRVELVHESLLTHWPRLVRWQTQDADGAQFRDQLRQAAQLWEESGRPEDMLWTGSVYQEYRIWRDRYRGGLTALEESFASASGEVARRRLRRRALTIGATIAALAAGFSHALGEIRLWPLDGMRALAPETLFREPGYGLYGLHGSDDGRALFTPVIDGTRGSGTLVGVSFPDRRIRTWRGASYWMAVDAEGRRIVATAEVLDRRSVVRVLDTETGAVTELGTNDEQGIGFVRDGRLLTRRGERLAVWDVEKRRHEVLADDVGGASLRLCPVRATILLHGSDGSLSFVGLDGSRTRTSAVGIEREGVRSWAADADCDSLVFGRDNGEVDVVRASTGAVWRMPLHDGWVNAAAVDPLGRWIASAGEDGVKLWPIPSGPSILDLPRDAFLAKLRSFTNLRAVKDDRQPNGYAIVGEGLPDWRNPPTW